MFRVKLWCSEYLIYCPMFLRSTFHDGKSEILRHIRGCAGDAEAPGGVCAGEPPCFTSRVASAGPFEGFAGFAKGFTGPFEGFLGGKEASKVSLLGTRKRTGPRTRGFRAFTVVR